MAPKPQRRPNALKLSEEAHVVVDNSSLLIGAQQGPAVNKQQDFAVRINVGNLVKIIEGNKNSRDIKTRIVGGNIPPHTSHVWKEWENCKYQCHLGNRDPKNKEVFLDDMLHAQIQRIILKHNVQVKGIQRTLILVTGDGNANDGRGVSFPEVVTSALEQGWKVELWSWEAALSRKFSVIQQQYSAKMKINELDQHRANITFKTKIKLQKKNNYTQVWLFGIAIFLILAILLVWYFMMI